MKKTVYLIGLIAIAFFLADYFGPVAFLDSSKWYMLVFFSALSYLLDLLNKAGLVNSGEKFIEYYLTFTVIRMIGSLIFITTFILLGHEKPILFVLNFFALYLCFTVFEINNLYRTLRRFSERR
ncbi:hypothetical protein SAMN06298216_0875 [Spirosomataceae bacterium TFI 002]|nr:hypothetical protein SAMN06298216_0875 [Spirosomataceae bacterium TFI 002]